MRGEVGIQLNFNFQLTFVLSDGDFLDEHSPACNSIQSSKSLSASPFSVKRYDGLPYSMKISQTKESRNIFPPYPEEL